MKREAIAVLSSGTPLMHSKFRNNCLLDIHGCEYGDVPLLGGHRADEVLGHVKDVWVENFVVKGTLRFTTLEGRRAFEELPSGVSIGSTFHQDDVVVVNRDGGLEDFDAREWVEYHQDPAAILHVKKWTLLECSLTDRPLDRGAIARPINHEARRIRRRMEERQRRGLDGDAVSLRAIMPSSGQILHGSPELIRVRQAEDRRLVFYGD